MSPVLFQEMLLGGRRNRQHVFRWIYAGVLVFELSIFLIGYFFAASGWFGFRSLPSYTEFASFSRYFIEFMTAQHFIVLLLVTPTVTAGAITDEKSRGTLQFLLTADLQPGEIVLAKMIGRSYQVILLTLTGLPLVAFFGVYAGLDPIRLLAFLAASFLLIFALAAASLLASVLCRHTRDAVLSLYSVILGLYVLSVIVHSILDLLRGAGSPTTGPSWLRGLAAVLMAFNPVEPLGTDWLSATGGEIGQRLLRMLLTWGLLGCGCLLVAVLRLRGAYLRYLQGSDTKKKRWWRAGRARLRDNPLTWKERHVEGVAPLALLRGLPGWLGLLLVILLTTVWAGYLLLLTAGESLTSLAQRVWRGDWDGLVTVVGAIPGSTTAHYFYWFLGLPVMLVAGLVVGIRCSGAVTGEREKQTWEALLLTPLETRQLIRGKFWGIGGATLPYLLAYAIPALGLSLLGGLAAFWWTLLWLAVTVLAMAFVGAAGLWCSVRSSSSWRSLLKTLGFAYGGGFVLYCVASPFAAILALIIWIILLVIDNRMGTGMAGAFVVYQQVYSVLFCLALASAFLFFAWRMVIRAEYLIGVLERTKHWKNEPRRRPIPLARPAPRVRSYEDDDY